MLQLKGTPRYLAWPKLASCSGNRTSLPFYYWECNKALLLGSRSGTCSETGARRLTQSLRWPQPLVVSNSTPYDGVLGTGIPLTLFGVFFTHTLFYSEEESCP